MPDPPSDRDELPDYPRSDGRPTKTGGLSGRIAIIASVLATIVLIAFALTRDDRPTGPANVITLAVEAAAQVTQEHPTSSPDSARDIIREEFGWNVGVPNFESAGLVAAGVARIAQTIEVPALLYRDDQERSATILILNYALLDQVADRMTLTMDQYDFLAEDPVPQHETVRRTDVVYWRDRGDIFIAVTDIPSDELVSGLQMDR